MYPDAEAEICRFCESAKPIAHGKKYIVSYRWPTGADEAEMTTADLSKIPVLLFAFLNGKAPGCPLIITNIQLADPDQYFKENE